jgi:hypothetical protein
MHGFHLAEGSSSLPEKKKHQNYFKTDILVVASLSIIFLKYQQYLGIGA